LRKNNSNLSAQLSSLQKENQGESEKLLEIQALLKEGNQHHKNSEGTEEKKEGEEEKDKARHHPYGALTRKELELKVFAQSEALVAQADKNQKLTWQLTSLKDKYTEAKEQLINLRVSLMKDLDSNADPTNYSNVQVTELLRLRLNRFDEDLKAAVTNMRGFTRGSNTTAIGTGRLSSRPVTSNNLVEGGGIAEEEVEGGGGDAGGDAIQNAHIFDLQIRKLKKVNRALVKKLQDRDDEILMLKDAQESLALFKEKNEEYVERYDTKKDYFYVY
jgi:hypothetical protein